MNNETLKTISGNLIQELSKPLILDSRFSSAIVGKHCSLSIGVVFYYHVGGDEYPASLLVWN